MVKPKHYANIVTFSSITLAIIALFLTLRLSLTVLPLILILGCAVLDGFDGKIARFYKAETALGEQLDTLNDLIAFGLLPVVILCTTQNFTDESLAFLAVLAYILASIFRLARFNVDQNKTTLKGLPITAAAVLFVLFQLLMQVISVPQNIIFVFILMLALLMVARFEWKKP